VWLYNLQFLESELFCDCYFIIYGFLVSYSVYFNDVIFCLCIKVLSAYEFEQHAGAKTRHPNNHIFLENRRAVYNIVQELKTAPRVVLEEVIRNVAGSALNEEGLRAWKGDGQVFSLLVHLCAFRSFD